MRKTTGVSMSINKFGEIKEKVKSAGPVVGIRFEDWETFCFDFEDGSELEISAGIDWSRCGDFDSMWTEFEYRNWSDNPDENVNIAYEHKWND